MWHGLNTLKPNSTYITSLKQMAPFLKREYFCLSKQNKYNYRFDLISQENTTANIFIPKFRKSIEKIEVNGKRIWPKNKLKKTNVWT